MGTGGDRLQGPKVAVADNGAILFVGGDILGVEVEDVIGDGGSHGLVLEDAGWGDRVGGIRSGRPEIAGGYGRLLEVSKKVETIDFNGFLWELLSRDR